MPAKHLEGLSGKAITSFERLLAEAGTLDVDGFREIVQSAAVERLALAEGFLDSSQRIPAATSADHRVAISRSYYAMYQAARSVVFAGSRQDVDDHEKLPKNLPKGFPDRERWIERIAFWRLKRNDLDYSPYVRAEDDLAKLREAAVTEAAEFCGLAGTFVRERRA